MNLKIEKILQEIRISRKDTDQMFNIHYWLKDEFTQK